MCVCVCVCVCVRERERERERVRERERERERERCVRACVCNWPRFVTAAPWHVNQSRKSMAIGVPQWWGS